jgi:hypothetical protein
LNGLRQSKRVLRRISAKRFGRDAELVAKRAGERAMRAVSVI